jgi:hypothetical protein
VAVPYSSYQFQNDVNRELFVPEVQSCKGRVRRTDRATDVEGLVPPGSTIASEDIRRKHAARQITQMRDIVDVG